MVNNWAIAIGINQYEFLPNAPLRFAENDALAMQRFLCEDAKFDPDKVMLCGDGLNGSQKATRSMLRQILLNKLQHAQNADNLWFFFSGHGMAGSDRQDYLMTIDGNPQDLQETAISIHFVIDQLRACKAKNIVLVLDMCRNESRETGRKSVESVETSLRQLVQDRDGQQGIITLFSCGRGESSYEIASLQQGAFTHALLEGLRQNTILKDLEAYLMRRVSELHQLAGKVRKQVPLVIPEPGWKYETTILSHYGTVGDVVRLKDLALDAEHDGDLDKAIRLWEQVNLLSTDPAHRSQALKALKALNRNIAIRAQQSLPQVTNPLPVASKQPSVEPASKFSVIEFTSIKVDSTGEILDRSQSKAEIFQEDLGNNVSLTMLKIPAGEFLMGSLTNNELKYINESPQHQVKLPAFYLSQTLVTQTQWKEVALLPEADCKLDLDPSYFKGGSRPVETINWYEANEFCKRLSTHTNHKYRLPSEAEWEYSCRADTNTPFHFGEILTLELANYLDEQKLNTTDGKSYIGRTTSTMNFYPNTFGLYDMHGNIREWCLDHWHDNYQRAPLDGSAWTSNGSDLFRILRGGSYLSKSEDCRSSSRHKDLANKKNYLTGFRIACSDYKQ
jgi:formylglycine-generating enzyme required for sulfatase activity